MKIVQSILLLINLCGFIAGAYAQQETPHHSEFVRDATCMQCHQQQSKQWIRSHHKLAMQKASNKTVLGKFNHAKFNHHGDVTTFYQQQNKYFIRTKGADDKLHDYEVKYTFGVAPLQQYLLELPGGRLQAFTIAWDVKAHKWFHLHPEKKVKANEPLHWTQSFYNWNSNCAACHSTNIQKNYDAKTKRYHTTWSEINVGCQACHGPGDEHLEWLNNKLPGKNKGFHKSHNSIEQCASCHSRRHPISAKAQAGGKFFNHFMPALLRSDLYYPDGQIKEEVFTYGSFLQSKMYRAGVTCMDCHNPHSLKLKHTGNALCSQCHNESPDKRFSGLKEKNYNTQAHYHHKPGTPGSKCVNCHMPERAYMQIDFRADHSFRIPRPDLSEKLGTPNACNQCHKDKSAAWASKNIKQWFGNKKHLQHYGEIFARARSHRNKSIETDLIQLVKDKKQANIVRATAVELLARYNNTKSIDARIHLLASDNVLIREATVRSLARLPIQRRLNVLAPLLKDPIRAIRIEVASSLSSVPKNHIPIKYQQALKQAINEYQSLQQANLDVPSSYFNLGNLYQNQGNHEKAIQAYQSSIDLDKSFYPAQQNLAMIFNSLGRKDEAQQVLTDAIQQNKERGELYYSLGLLFAEQKNMNKAIDALKKASALLPNHSRVQYNYALALNSQGKYATAEKILLNAYKLNPNDPDSLYALAMLNIRLQKWREALRYAKELQNLFPESTQIKKMIEFIKLRTKHPA